MIKITDKENGSARFWEVVDTTGNMSTTAIHYNKDDPINYDRLFVLKQIVNFHAMSGYADIKWEKEGYILILNKKE